jgi:hypothetical protein
VLVSAPDTERRPFAAGTEAQGTNGNVSNVESKPITDIAASTAAASGQEAANEGQPTVEVKPEPDSNGAEDDEDEETYELDATQLLGAFKEEKVETEEEVQDAEDLMQQFMADMRAVDRDNEVNRILWAFKLNPFEKMNLRFTATAAEVKKQYRRVLIALLPFVLAHILQFMLKILALSLASSTIMH